MLSHMANLYIHDALRFGCSKQMFCRNSRGCTMPFGELSCECKDEKVGAAFVPGPTDRHLGGGVNYCTAITRTYSSSLTSIRLNTEFLATNCNGQAQNRL